MLTFTAKNKLGFMRKSLFYKRTLHTKDGSSVKCVDACRVERIALT